VATVGLWALAASVGCEPNRLLRQQGMDALEVGDVELADNRFTKASRQDSTDWKSMFYLGKIRLDQGEWVEAQVLLEKALSIRGHHPETDDILDGMAETLFRQGEKDRLYAMLKQTTQDRPVTKSYLRQAKYFYKLGDVDGAKVAYQKAARFALSTDASPYLEMADFYESIGDTGATVTALRQAYAIDPSTPGLSDRLRDNGIVPGPTAGLSPLPHPE
jgi:tetratricopeptide (TPR) repeat protein